MSEPPRGPIASWTYPALMALVLTGLGCGEVFGDPISGPTSGSGASSAGGQAIGGNGGEAGSGGVGGAEPSCSWAGKAAVSTVATSQDLNDPVGVVVDKDCNIFVADRQHHRIVRVGPQGAVSVFAGSGTEGLAGGPAATAQFKSPQGVALDPSTGDLLVADSFNHSIRRISEGIVSTEAGTGEFAFNDGNTDEAKFKDVSGIAVSNAGDIYVADPKNGRIRLISGGMVSTFAGSGEIGSDDGPALSASFNAPRGVAVSADGSVVLVADTGNHLIRKIVGGEVSTLSGTGVAGYVEGEAAEAQLDSPHHIVWSTWGPDTKGVALFADRGNQVIRRLAADGSTSLIAGVPMSAGNDDGPLASARFDFPSGLAVGPSNVIVVGDSKNNAVRVFGQ